MNPEEEENNIKNNEVKHFLGKSNSDIVHIPVLFRQNALSPTNEPKMLDAPITSFRIFFKILNDVSHYQFQPKKQPRQLQLFEEAFNTVDNSVARFTFKVSDIDKYNDYNSIMQGLVFLEGLHKTWHESKNKEGKPIKSRFGLIERPTISEGKVSFLMSAKWLNQIVPIPKYNKAFFSIAWEFSKGKHFLFFLWLLELAPEGTTFGFEKFQKTFGYNYSKASEFARGVLKPIKFKLDTKSNVSFNYSVSGNNISVVPYNPVLTDLPIKKKTSTNQLITQKVNYWKVRHKLSVKDATNIKAILKKDKSFLNILKKAYNTLVKISKENKKMMTDYKGEDFLNLFHEQILETYKHSVWFHSAPNGCPDIRKGDY